MEHWRNQRGNKKVCGDKWKWKHNNPKSIGLGNSKNSSKREAYCDTSLPQERRKISKNNLTRYLKELEKE